MSVPKLYEIVWTEQTICTAYVRADDAQQAKRMWREGNLVSEPRKVYDGSHLIETAEMPSFHDKLCCCPTCEEKL
jgi:hypothetical protein